MQGTARAIDLELVAELYERWGRDLAHVRRYQRLLNHERFDSRRGHEFMQSLCELSNALMVPATFHGFTGAQFDDLEAELTYMLIREVAPELVTEISPCGGWSTSWILNALQDNGVGKVRSFDVHDECLAKIPRDLSSGFHEFCQGDVRQSTHLPEQIEYMFLDSDHTTEFGRWAVDVLFPRVRSGAVVSVHDVFHPGGSAVSGGEGVVVLDWLEERGISWFTMAPSHAPDIYEMVQRVRQELGFELPIHESTINPSIFFVMP